MPCFACIFVPDFPAESIIRMEPDLRALPIAVLEGNAPLEKVFAINENARALNVDPGMTKTQLDAWTNLLLRPRSELREKGAHQALLDCAQSFSPSFEDTAPDTVVIDLDGLEHLFGTPTQIARQIAHRASVLGLKTNVAAAFNPDTALLAARGFPGVTFIPEGNEAKRLGELPVNVLFEGLLSPEQQKKTDTILETFDRWGIRNLRALAALPEIPLVERLGQEGLRLQQSARGSYRRTLKLVQPSLIFEESVELEFPIVLLEPLAFVLNRMLEQICNRLAARALAAQELKLCFELATEFRAEEESENSVARKRIQNSHSLSVHATRSTTFTRTLKLPVPMLDARVFLKLLQLDLRAHPPGAPIMKIHLTIEPAQPRTAQGGLFVPPFPEPEKLELTLARIAGIVGEGSVGAVEFSDTHRPESFRMKHFAPEEQDSLKPTNRTPKAETSNKTDANSASAAILLEDAPPATSVINPEKAPVTALRIFRPPLQAEVTMLEGTPVRLVCPKKKDVRGEIIWAAGPWRSSGDWWEQEGWARDEWDIMLQNETGIALYRLVRDHFSTRWTVEGSYD
jgi:protein ImuB